jgi:hypothetical protein
VTVTTADDHAVSALIDEGGGTLTATLGSLTYTLTVPADALLSPETITMTPIIAITGAPLEETPVGGVVFAPDGLLLAAPALLTITGGPSTDGTIGFGFDGAGEEFLLVPFVPGTGVVLPVPHFSGVAYGAASPAIVARIVSGSDAKGIDAITQAAAPLMKELQTAYKADDQERVQTILGELEVMAVEQANFAEDGLRAAGDDPLVLGEAAIMRALGEDRMFQLLGFDATDNSSLILALLDKWDAAVDALCAEKATEPGATAKPVLGVDPMAMINLILASERQRTLVTGVETPGNEVQARLDACRFTIKVKPEIAWSAVDSEHYGVTPGYETTHTFTLAGPVTPLVLSVSQVPRMPLGVARYRWKADVPLSVSDFTTSDTCWTKAPPIPIPGMEPTLHVEITPNLNLVVAPIGAPAGGASSKRQKNVADVVLDLRGAIHYAWRPEDDNDPLGFCQGDGGSSDGIGVDLVPSWSAVHGASREQIPFVGGTVSWTRKSPLGSTWSGSPMGYYALTTDVTFSAVQEPN